MTRVTENEAILDGKFFITPAAGRETFEVVKEMEDLQEWSYGFDIRMGGDDCVNRLMYLDSNEVVAVVEEVRSEEKKRPAGFATDINSQVIQIAS